MGSRSAALQLALLVFLWAAELSGQSPPLTRGRRQSPVVPDCLDVCGLPFPVCKNGGTCRHRCPHPECICPPGFTGKDCSVPTSPTTAGGTTSKDVVTSSTPAADVTLSTGPTPNVTTATAAVVNLTSQAPFDNGTSASAPSGSVTAATPAATSRGTPSPTPPSLPCPPFLCVHGTCDQAMLAENKILCDCDEGWSGSTCDTPCTLTCENGVCGFHEGKQVCQCNPLYVNQNNVCVPRPEEPPPKEDRRWVGVVVACSVLLVLLVLLLVLLPYWLWRKRDIFILKVVYFFKPYEDEDGKLFDAFVSYVSSPRDESFVYRRLYPKLERELGFKLCLHHRDFKVGETIANNIIWAVQNSRRTLLILSPSYLKSDFTRFEYQEAQREMLRLKHRIVPVLLEDVEAHRPSMDPTLKSILASITYVRWPVQSASEDEQQFQLQELQGDAEEGFEKQVGKFWKRLELALPKKKRPPETSSAAPRAADLQVSSSVQDGGPSVEVSPSSTVSPPPCPPVGPPPSTQGSLPPTAPPVEEAASSPEDREQVEGEDFALSFVEGVTRPRSLEEEEGAPVRPGLLQSTRL